MPKRIVIKIRGWYNVRIGLKNRPDMDAVELDLLLDDLRRLIIEPLSSGEKFMCGNDLIDPNNVSEIQITRSEYLFSEKMTPLIPPTYAQKWRWVIQGKNVTGEFDIRLPKKRKVSKMVGTPLSRNIFIVHGRDHKPMKELKAMLREFGLNPIVLHEQPSASRTIVEKLEKYSDVGYAFVILTPDDEGISSNDFDKEILKKGPIGRKATNAIDSMLSKMRVRARQNVVLEFGYFIGKLERDRVCCLHKGNVELPSDMHGIVYIPFKESVNEVGDKIVKELKAAGYEIKL